VRPDSDLCAPELNPVYAAMLAHYGVVADSCRVHDRIEGHRGERHPAHAGRAQGPALRVARGAERVARAVGGAVGGAAQPWPEEAPGQQTAIAALASTTTCTTCSASGASTRSTTHGSDKSKMVWYSARSSTHASR
jgi:hypothetical protein